MPSISSLKHQSYLPNTQKISQTSFKGYYFLFKMSGRNSKRARAGKNVASSSSTRPPVYCYKDGSYLRFNSEEQLMRFTEKFENREILPPRFSTNRFLNQSAPPSTANILLQSQLLEFLYLHTPYIHPSLIQAFYSNLEKDEDGELFSTVNGIHIPVSEANIQAITKLPRNGEDILLYTREEGALFDEQLLFTQIGIGEFFPTPDHRRPTITNMLPEYRLIFYFITRVLKPRKFNHTTISHEDSKLMHAIITGARINWCKFVKTHMFDAIGEDKPLPYAFVVMTLLVASGVDTSVGPHKKATKHWEIQESSFPNIGEHPPPPPPQRRRPPAPSDVSLHTISEQIASLSTSMNRIDMNVTRLSHELHGYFDHVNYPYAQIVLREDVPDAEPEINNDNE